MALPQYREGNVTVGAGKIISIAPFVPQPGALTLVFENGARTNVNREFAARCSPEVGGYFVVFDANTARFMRAVDFNARFTKVDA